MAEPPIEEKRRRMPEAAYVEEIASLRRTVVLLEGENGRLVAENRVLRADVEYWGRIGRKMLLIGGFPELEKLEGAILESAGPSGDGGEQGEHAQGEADPAVGLTGGDRQHDHGDAQ